MCGFDELKENGEAGSREPSEESEDSRLCKLRPLLFGANAMVSPAHASAYIMLAGGRNVDCVTGVVGRKRLSSATLGIREAGRLSKVDKGNVLDVDSGEDDVLKLVCDLISESMSRFASASFVLEKKVVVVGVCGNKDRLLLLLYCEVQLLVVL